MLLKYIKLTFLAGKKAKLVSRLVTFEFTPPTEKSPKQELLEFLTPTAQVQPNEKPTIIRHYANTFNVVDKLDALLGHIPYPYRIGSAHLVFLIQVIRFAVINSYALFGCISFDPQEQNEALQLKEYVQIIANDLLK